MDFNKLCAELLKLNQNMRFAGIYCTADSKVYYKMQEGINKIFDDEQTKDSMVHGYMRWKSRLHASDLIGVPIYTMTKYPKINRVTMPCGDKNLLMFSTEVNLEPNQIIDDVCKLIEKFKDPADYEPRAHQLSF